MFHRSNFRKWRVQALLILVIGAAAVALISYHAHARMLPGPEISVQQRPINTLRDFNQAFIDLAAMVKPAVVTVSTEKTLTYRSSQFGSPFAGDPFFNFFFGPRGNQQQQQPKEYRQRGLGSGVIVSADGYILTNNHVVDDADTIYVRTSDGRDHSARVIGVDPKTDIAVLKIDGSDLDYMPIGNSDKLQVGEMVLAIGSPMSENLAQTVTQGIVSAKGRSNVGLADYEDFIQTDAAINPGNSGGPLVNLDGELVGINTAIASQSGGFQGIGFAVPSNMAERVMNSLISQGKVIRGWLGVSIQDVSETMASAMGLKEPSGALVGDVMPDSPAEKAGMKSGDVIVGLSGQTIANTAELRNAIAATAPGTKVKLDIIRDDNKQEVSVALGEQPADGSELAGSQGLQELLGFSFTTIDRDLAGKYGIDGSYSGAVVTGIDENSSAYGAGLRVGDLIQAAQRQRVSTADDLAKIFANGKKGDTVLLRIMRNGRGFFVAFEL